MAQLKYSSVKMPQTTAANLILGCSAWFQSGLNVNDDSTWDGIIIDPDGSTVGVGNIGLTVWNNKVKGVQINSEGIRIIGGLSAWVPDNYMASDESTWRGVVIDSTGINLFQVKNGMFDTDENLDLMPSTNNALLGTAKPMMTMTVDGIVMYGGACTWVTENYDITETSNWHGMVINWAGIYAFNGSTDPTVFIDARTGDFTLGVSTGQQLKYTASTGIFSVPAISTDILAAGSLTSGTGLLLQSSGLYGYKSSVQTFYLNASTGDFTFGTTSGKKLEFVASTGALTVGGSFIGTVATYLSTSQLAAGSNPATGVVVDNAGIRAYASSAKTVDIASSGDVTIGASTGPQLKYTASTGIFSVPAISTDILAAGSLTSGTGVLLSSAGISAASSGVKTLDITSSGDVTIGASTGQQLKYTASTGIFSVPAISTDILAAGLLTSGTGLLLQSSGLYGYKSSVQTFYLNASTGDFTFGTTSGKKLEFVASTGALTVGGSFIGTVATYLSTSQLAAGSNPATGVVVDNAGIRAYASSAKTVDIASSGYITIGSNAGNQIIFDASTGQMAIGSLTAGTGVLFNKDGISGWKSGVKTFGVDMATGNAVFSGEITAATINSGGSLTMATSGTAAQILFTSIAKMTGGATTFDISPWTANTGYLYLGRTSTQWNFIEARAYTGVTISTASASVVLGTGIILTGDTTITGQATVSGAFGTWTSLGVGTDAYIVGNCSAQSFTDRTPYPDSLQAAHDALISMEPTQTTNTKGAKTKSNQLDHSKLHDFVRSRVKNLDGNEVDGRDMSATISCLVECVKYLMNQNGGIK